MTIPWVPMTIPVGFYDNSYGFLWTFLWLPMKIPMGSFDNSHGFLCKFLWVPMKFPMGSYENSYGLLWKCIWVPMKIPMGSFENAYGFLWKFLWVPMKIPMGSYGNSYGFLWNSYGFLNTVWGPRAGIIKNVRRTRIAFAIIACTIILFFIRYILYYIKLYKTWYRRVDPKQYLGTHRIFQRNP